MAFGAMLVLELVIIKIVEFLMQLDTFFRTKITKVFISESIPLSHHNLPFEWSPKKERKTTKQQYS